VRLEAWQDSQVYGGTPNVQPEENIG
jgi:hypothetical protein